MTRSMTRWMLAGCTALAAFGAVTVFDVGTPAAEAAPSVSRFAGSWSGPWSEPVLGVDGDFDWTISGAGRISGTVYHDQVGQGGTVVGHVGTDGTLMMVGFAPADAPAEWFNGFAFKGTATIDDEGKLVVAVTRTDSTGLPLDAVLQRN